MITLLLVNPMDANDLPSIFIPHCINKQSVYNTYIAEIFKPQENRYEIKEVIIQCLYYWDISEYHYGYRRSAACRGRTGKVRRCNNIPCGAYRSYTIYADIRPRDRPKDILAFYGCSNKINTLEGL